MACSNEPAPSSVANTMKQWRIPFRSEDVTMEAAELVLLERLVWVRYHSMWWPAILYDSYAELQDEIADEMDSMIKAQFAMAIIRQIKDNTNVRVARILGRAKIEVVEIQAESWHEFYSMVPKVLPRALNPAYFGTKPDLFLEFHRALDHVEAIISEVTKKKIALGTNTTVDGTWLDRAQHRLRKVGIVSIKTYVAGNRRHSHNNTVSAMGTSKSSKRRRHSPIKVTLNSDNRGKDSKPELKPKREIKAGQSSFKSNAYVSSYSNLIRSKGQHRVHETKLGHESQPKLDVSKSDDSITKLRETMKVTDMLVEKVLSRKLKTSHIELCHEPSREDKLFFNVEEKTELQTVLGNKQNYSEEARDKACESLTFFHCT